MTPERWERVKTLYESARARPVSDRSAYLARECGGDTDLRLEVEALLDQPVRTEDFVRAFGGAAQIPGPPPSDPDALLVGQRLGTFELRSLLGRGGMGEVYRAHDSRLGRDVAIKVLPQALVADAGRVASLEQEARVVAALNHPHIAAIHGLEVSGAVRGLVLELVEGPTLAQKIADAARSSPPGLRLKEILSIARQIADALEAAHDKGILHRDLKPSNVKLTHDGVVKLLDFGIAKVMANGRAEGSIEQTHTATNATRAGLIAGTAAYMSPEQARGKTLDRRTDIWAFGCVLYEMLTGTMAFAGDTVSDTIAAVLEREPEWAALPASTPSAVRRLVQRCLEKEPRQRLHDIGDARLEIERILQSPGEDGDAAAARHETRTWRQRAQVAAALAALGLLAAAGLGGSALWRERPPTGDSRVVRMTVELPKGQVIGPEFNSKIALSRDGAQLAIAGFPGAVSVRRLSALASDTLEVTTPPGFRGAPFFSPDGTSLAFIEGNSSFSAARPFFRTPLGGGAPVKLADYDSFFRGAWASDGWIYWTAAYPGGIVRIRDAGGAIEPVTEIDVPGGERSQRFVSLLPGGDALLYTTAFDGIDSYNDARIDVWDMKRRQTKTLVRGGTSAVYSPSGHLVYARAGKLFAVPFDVGRREVTGEAMEVLDGVMMSGNTGAAEFTMSERGDLAYVPGAVDGGNRTLVWVDRSGKADPLPLPPASYLYPHLSPDGRSLAVEIEGPNHDFYLYDFTRAVLSKMTTDGLSHDPVWSPDGQRLAFRSWLGGGMTMWMMPADRSAPATRLDPSGTRQSPVAFSPDGKFLAFNEKTAETLDDVMVLPLSGGAPLTVARSRFFEGSGRFSPDGRWIAFASAESGRPQIYVQAFPGPGAKIQVSTEPGTDPIWRADGRELFYRSGDAMMAVPISVAGTKLTPGSPTRLWQAAYSHGSGSSCGMPGIASINYDVTADGQRFLMVREDPVPPASQVVVVLNWAEELRAKERARAQAARTN